MWSPRSPPPPPPSSGETTPSRWRHESRLGSPATPLPALFSRPPTPPPQHTTTHGMTERQFAAYNQANTVRLGWGWGALRTAGDYVPVVAGKWWSDRAGSRWRRPAVIGHVGRIMETELGERRDERCTACQQADEECWYYSAKGSQQVSRPGDACARCRWAARKCSGSKRQPAKRHPSKSPPPRQLKPWPPGGGPPPGAGGDAIMA